ncbi:unnamed protein product [Rangifer tarandus platyrhynchus]|uniref:Uncharacterized protein n=1 Tax=Rangifer tarandus platyrhynchus TaxID=3082113 RepID=A0AC59Y822_RANTA
MAHALSRLEASERGFHTPTLSATGSRLRQQTQAPRHFWSPACRMGKAATVAQGRSSGEVPPKAPQLGPTTGHRHRTSSPAFKLLQRTLNRVESVAVNCETRLKVENGTGFHCYPREAQLCCRATAGRQSLPGWAPATQSGSEAAYRCNPGTASRAAGREDTSPRAPASPPAPRRACAGPSPPHPAGFSASAPERLEKEAGGPPELRRLRFGRRRGAAEASPRLCGQPGSGKVFPSSQQRRPRSPPRGEQPAARAPAPPPPPPAARSGRRDCSLSGSGPGARGEAAADAGGSEGGSRPAQTAPQRRGGSPRLTAPSARGSGLRGARAPPRNGAFTSPCAPPAPAGPERPQVGVCTGPKAPAPPRAPRSPRALPRPPPPAAPSAGGRGAGGHAPHEYERTHAPAPRAG